TRGLGHFQELDQVAITRSFCKHAAWVHRGALLPAALDSAIAAATAPRPGPVHLCIPSDILSETVEPPKFALPSLEVPEGPPPDPEAIEAAAAALAAARSPALIAGSGAFYGRAGDALQELARLADLPVFTPLWDRGCVNQPWPQYAGVTSGEVN